MIGVFVTFRYGDNFDEQAVQKIAETARARFEGMPGLRSKAFTVHSGKRECWRRPNIDHPCRLNIDQGWKADRWTVGCG